jgi:hypothetical protein
MGNTTVRSVLNRAAALLNDEDYERWEQSELLEWLNDGQRVIARGPATDVYVLRDNMEMVAGTRQSLPGDGIRLIDLPKNVSTGRSILQADYAMTNVLQSAWRSASAGEAENYFYDERNPKEFEVFPPQAGGEVVEIIYNAEPPDVLVSGNIAIDDVFADTLIDYVVYRALSKDNEDVAAEQTRAAQFYQQFLVGAGMKDATDVMIEPRRS